MHGSYYQLYSFSGFQVVWNNWPQAHIGALIPGVFWAIEYTLVQPASILLPCALLGLPAVVPAVFALVLVAGFMVAITSHPDSVLPDASTTTPSMLPVFFRTSVRPSMPFSVSPT